MKGSALVALPAEIPILPSLIAEVVPPDDWWAVSLPLPHQVAPGTRVRVAAGESLMEGVVVGEMHDNGFQLTASVAFAPRDAPLVATSAADSAIVVMIGPVDPIVATGG